MWSIQQIIIIINFISNSSQEITKVQRYQVCKGNVGDIDAEDV